MTPVAFPLRIINAEIEIEEPASWTCLLDWRTMEDVLTCRYPCGVEIEVRETAKDVYAREAR